VALTARVNYQYFYGRHGAVRDLAWTTSFMKLAWWSRSAPHQWSFTAGCACVIFVLGGCGDSSSSSPSSDGTYVLQAHGWSRVTADEPAGLANCSQLVMAPKQRGLMYLHDGVASFWSGSSWSPQQVIGVFPNIFGCSAAFNPVSDRMVLLGGAFPRGFDSPRTFEYDGAVLVESPAVLPQTGFISDALLTYDPRLQSVVLVTIAPSPTNPKDQSAALWRWSGSGWESIPDSTTTVFSRADVTWNVVYDLRSDSLVLFGNGETLTWNGRWSSPYVASTTMGLDPTYGVGAAYDPLLNEVVGISTDGMAWTWTGSDWVRLIPAVRDVPASFIAYDATHMQLIAIAFTAY
jgi:hypothetical protein